MRAVLQRVTRATVQIYASAQATEPRAARRIERGFVVLLGVARGDSQAEADRLVSKLIGLRVFADAEGKMNLDILQADGEFLVVSQFTLLADTRKGRRPSFVTAADPETGEALYLYLVHQLREQGFAVQTGDFGTHMLVEIANDGPVTILLDTAEL